VIPQLSTDRPLVVSKFSSLFVTEVAEVIQTTIDAWLRHLLIEPGDEWAGQSHSGWSPVEFEPSKRSRENVKRVYLLVLDYDKGAEWNKLAEYWREFRCTLYTTKSHGRDGVERLRVVVGLTRPVSAEEYARVWEWGARVSPCPADKQTKDPSRFWYSPTLPPGGWRAELFEGAMVDPDVVLRTARPAVRSAPPVTASSDQRVRRARGYIAKVPGAVAGSSGHTATFNAVASVMVGFDLSEAEARPIIDEWNQTCSPPWSEKDLDHKFASVAKDCQRQRGYLLGERQQLDTRTSPSRQAPPLDGEVDHDWFSMMLLKPDKSARKAQRNVEVYVRHHPDFRGRWSLDTMNGSAWLDDAPVDDEVIHQVIGGVEEKLGFTPPREHVVSSIHVAAKDRPFHPVRQYLRSLDWDGVPRLQTMASDYLGSSDPKHAQMVRKWMISACARVLRPGCKVDTALMLVGAQGIGKSTFFSVLGGQWHADTYIDITSKDGLIQLHSTWLYELSELENVLSGSKESRMKAWMTSAVDLYRAPYQRTLERKARSCVLCGTTNRNEFLTDDTGSRRYWIVRVQSRIDRRKLSENRDQLWAEAVAAAEAGESWWLDDDDAADLEASNREFAESDSWSEPVIEFLKNPALQLVSIHDVLLKALEVDTARQDRWAQMRCARLLRNLGWSRVRHIQKGHREWRYRRPNETSDGRGSNETEVGADDE
jgi:predicted P-loop ATPase